MTTAHDSPDGTPGGYLERHRRATATAGVVLMVLLGVLLGATVGLLLVRLVHLLLGALPGMA
ncbi:hypothetical protein [Nocardioides sp. zg-DK7169]|uniref:hypothetical protein n=1 Tax=Nocardioides sp. zg-DK7169 TaxID=2736600 RepID=UPI00155442C2|nr:hypothetical protein [Nocardioides sp. zg-DK7169]NPC96563.1 hypothetical protein [Nocardioides sp. zg-DK7169]